MLQTEFAPILKHLDRLEAVVLESSEFSLGDQGQVHKNEIKKLIDSIRSAIPTSERNRQEDVASAGCLSSNSRGKMSQDAVEAGSTLYAVSRKIRSRMAVFHSRLNSKEKLRRKHCVKILLSDNELYLLERAVEDSGLDRASIFRHLLLNYANACATSGQLPKDNESGEQISRITISDMGVKPLKPTILLVEPRDFDEMPRAIQALRERKSVILNLTMMEPDQAQRAVDFVAGGTFAIDGHQERVGESIFLFSPATYDILASNDESGNNSPSLIKGEAAEDLVPNQLSLTPFQESCLKIIRDRWDNDQCHTTPSELVGELNLASDPNASFRLIRRTLHKLSKDGLIQRVLDDVECYDYRPVLNSDAASSTELAV
jgi:hypothetical protein